jgi:peptidoglycan/LPS O-acetylase OafA/YrhL
VSIGGGVAREHAWPKNGTPALIATIALVIIASATDGTKIAPLVRAMGLLVLLAAVIASVPAFHVLTSKKASK